eukprot:Gb_13285 [translate_table: standard]
MRYDKGSSSSECLVPMPSENSPLLRQSSSEDLSSVVKTFANILIAIVGASVLGLPYTFMRTGWLVGLLILFSVGAISYYCMMMLVFSKRKMMSDGITKINSYGVLGYYLYGNLGKGVVDFLVVFSQAGFCVGYLIFIGNTVSSIFLKRNSKLGLGISGKTGFTWLVFPFEVAMGGIQSLTHLAPFSMFADIANIAAIVMVMVEDCITFVHSKPIVEAVTSISAIPYGVGVAIYAFEGISMVLPLETAMEKKHKFGRVLGLAYFVITVVYGCFGALGYLAFGNDTEEIVTLNLGRTLVSDLVQLGLCLGLFFTFPLMMNPVHEIIERRFNGNEPSFILRSMVVFLTTAIAVLVPHFADFLSLVGSSVCCILGFVLPAVVHMHACWRESSWFHALADVLIIVFGVVFGILGTFSSVRQIISR